MRLARLKAPLIWLLLAAILVLTGPKIERLGDRFQVALPLAALGCDLAQGRAWETIARFGFGWVSLHVSKRVLGEQPINARPKGGYQGMPSGHTHAATFGATRLIMTCITDHPATQLLVTAAALHTGFSRTETGAHTPLQTLIGGAWGIFCAAFPFVRLRLPKRKQPPFHK